MEGCTVVGCSVTVLVVVVVGDAVGMSAKVIYKEIDTSTEDMLIAISMQFAVCEVRDHKTYCNCVRVMYKPHFVLY